MRHDRVVAALVLGAALGAAGAGGAGVAGAQTPIRGQRVLLDGGGSLPEGNTTGLAGNDDGSSAHVGIGFDLNFFGQTYDRLWVNNNGNVTFGSALSTFTPFGLTGASSNPIIAAYFADVDTRAVADRGFVDGLGNPVARPTGVGLTSYGAYSAGSDFGQLFNPGGPNTGPGHNVFSVTWSDVGYYAGRTDLTNTFQLNLIEREDTGPGLGNFDIEMNYEQVQWEAGEASGGVDGLGGTSAAVGFSSGNGGPGTFTQLTGSFVNGAFVDGGTSALVSGAFGSAVVGRYVFAVRNSGTGAPGATPGTALLPTEISPGDPGSGIAPAYIFRNAASGMWYDPPFTDSYVYEALDASTMFSGVTLPTGLGDDLFDICWGALFGTCQLGWSGGSRFDFLGTPQSIFRVSGIDPLRDVADPNAFPTQLDFVNRAGNQFRMTPVLPAVVAAPEPQTWLLLGAGLVALYAVRRRAARAA